VAANKIRRLVRSYLAHKPEMRTRRG
jgi:hypothetical protein